MSRRSRSTTASPSWPNGSPARPPSTEWMKRPPSSRSAGLPAEGRPRHEFLGKSLLRLDEEAGGGLLGDRALVAVQADRDLVRGRLRRAHDDARAGHEALVVEPVQELAVVLREPDDGRCRPGLERRERRELPVLRLLDLGIDRPAVRTPLRVPELVVDARDHLVVERVAELVRALVRLVPRVAHEVREESLDDPVLADDPLRALPPGLGEERLLALAALDQALGLEPLEHLAGRRPRDMQHLRHARCQGRRARPTRGVLADRKREEIDRLEVLVDGVALRHLAILPVPPL